MFKLLALIASTAFAAEPIIITAPRPIIFVPASSFIAHVQIPLPLAGRVGVGAAVTQQFRYDTQIGLWVPKHLSESVVFTPAASELSSDSSPEVFAKAASDDFDDGILHSRQKRKESTRPIPPPPSPYSDAQIVEMATQLAKSYKGSPWSYTEYNSVLYPTLDNLRQQGVPDRQLGLFRKTCDDYPGRPFNPWSGD